MNKHLTYLLLLLMTATQAVAQQKDMHWQKLNTVPYPGKQDDICFTDENTGWYGNGSGKIYHTSDGGNTWTLQLTQKGTFFRCMAFTDSMHGFAGTLGTDYYPGVTDTIPLYATQDAGKTWAPVAYTGPYVKGLCGMDVVREKVSKRGYRYHIYGVGRVGGPASFMYSHDSGKTFTSIDMSAYCEAMYDVKFTDKNNGFACASTTADPAEAHALILRTTDGGKTWTKVYESARLFENCWKMHFPTAKVGYATIQSNNPDTTQTQQRLVKTTDGGKSWKELPLCNDYKARQFGIGFIDERHGYLGTVNTGYETHDGGSTWTPVNMGRACNKIRIGKNAKGKTYGYAIGIEVYKLSTDAQTTPARTDKMMK